MISDNLVSLNVALGNGTAMTVNATTNPDLWWTFVDDGSQAGAESTLTLFNQLSAVSHQGWERFASRYLRRIGKWTDV